MLRHHLVVAVRNLLKHRLQTALAIAVLTLGLGCFLAAYLFLHFLTSHDAQWAKSARLYAVYQSSVWHTNNYRIALGPRSSFVLADALRADVPEAAAVARYLYAGSAVSVDGGEPQFRRVAYADERFLDMFDLTAVAGDLRTALTRPRSAIVTESAARALFGSGAAVGRTLTLRYNERVDVTVAAVVADVERPSFLRRGFFSPGFEILATWDAFEQIYDSRAWDPKVPGAWLNPSPNTFVLLHEDGSIARLNARLAALAEAHSPKNLGSLHLEARPISRVALDNLQAQLQGVYSGSTLPVPLATILWAFGALILGVACLNFVNLTTAGSAARAREIGVRKALGATVGKIVLQDLLQTALTVAAAIACAFAVIVSVAEPVSRRWRLLLDVPWSTPRFWLFIVAVIALVTLAAGLYPAIALARAPASTALRLGASKGTPPLLRTVLVGSQFASAALLIAAAAVVLEQSSASRAALLGRFVDRYVLLAPALRTSSNVSFDVLTTELARDSSIKGVTGIAAYPWIAQPGRRTVRRTPGDSAAGADLASFFVSYDFFAVMDVPLLAGRAFSHDFSDDATPASETAVQARKTHLRTVIDRAAARALGWSDPAAAVGQTIYFSGGPVEIIGVVGPSSLTLRAQDLSGSVYLLSPQYAQFTVVRFGAADAERALAHIDAVVRRIAPDVPPQRLFLDQAFETAYFPFTLMSRVLAGLAAFAIAISGIGLFGMASDLTRRRTREIGLRKTQGATSGRVLWLLLWDFAKPVLLANVAVWPLTFIAAEKYLALFAERMPLTPLPFAVALAATLAMAAVAVSGHAMRAAQVRPTAALLDR